MLNITTLFDKHINFIFVTFMYEYSIYIGVHSFSSFQFLLCHIIHSITYGFWIGEKKPLISKMEAMLHSYKTISPCIGKILAVVDDATLKKAKCEIGELGLKLPDCHVLPNLLSLNFYASEKLHS